ncbi:MAG: tripartite tricarboxylate transporter substrate binding protein [Pigmentiphaga sp.]|uniref:Bug family tripartite tricarboxylate transporter substrate binding protein n=1 Tax=Pigmentiphaga sp. TaxID=1977564 RepID=UPI0029A49522|nr:tripartite tricarboxylate transporter substrate binding protein [Pigmentiphaga sp.]MDX3905117.1 tripartite tricarboxylate transporter substrate binding protein [Pigmentiphaga sp.]
MHNAVRRNTLAAALLTAATAGAAFPALAQDYPSKPIRLIVPFPAGGPSDTTARSIAEGLGKELGQPVVVENKPGAGAIIGSEFVLGQPADGHTLLMASNVISTGKWLYPSMDFEPVRDFRAVVGVFRSPHQVAVAPDFPGQGIQDLIAMARREGGRMNYGSGGSGTMPHLGAERFKQVTGVEMQHIPYRGSAPANVALVAGDVPVHFDIEFSVQPLLKSGRLRSLGVTALKRSPQFPDVPTLDEQGVKGFELYSWFGIVARTGTPDSVVNRLNQAINRVMETPAFKERLAALGAEKIGGPPRAFEKMIKDDYRLWGDVIRKANIKID